MKLHVLSDLHLEFADFTPISNTADVIVLAGDIDLGSRGISWARKSFPKQEIIYVAGNHEFYGSQRSRVIDDIRSNCSKYGVYFLDNNVVQLQDSKSKARVRFLGATLWTDFLLFGESLKTGCISLGNRCLNDFRRIKEDDTVFSVTKSIELHEHSLAWILEELKSPFDGKTVIVSHHLPSMQSVAERYKRDLLSACFASELSHLFGKMSLWIHGHTHDSFDYEINGTRVVCNPRGYVRSNHAENQSFNPSLIIEI
jgi:predicted phosphodiesterase